MRTDRQTDMKLTVAFRNSANAPTKTCWWKMFRYVITVYCNDHAQRTGAVWAELNNFWMLQLVHIVTTGLPKGNKILSSETSGLHAVSCQWISNVSSTLMIETEGCSETSVKIYQITQRHIPEGSRNNLQFNTKFNILCYKTPYGKSYHLFRRNAFQCTYTFQRDTQCSCIDC